jgi:hypothetical protein
MKRAILGVVILMWLAPRPGHAVPIVTVSGPSPTAASAAEAAFLASLGTLTTESFEGFPVGYVPSSVTAVGAFSQIKAGDNNQACAPHCSDGLWVLDAPHSPEWGRYKVGEGSNWLDSNDSKQAEWVSSPLAAPTRLGFYLVDPNDAGGLMDLLIAVGGSNILFGDFLGGAFENGGIFYVTVFDPAGINSILFTSNHPNDGYGIDRFTIEEWSAVPEPSGILLLGTAVPEPSGILLLGTGLLLLFCWQRRQVS